MPRINFNGTEYASVDAMPPDVRREYERLMIMLPDSNGDGIPDAVENDPANVTVQYRTKYVVNGKTYHSLDDMPPELQDTFRKAMAGRESRPGGALSGPPPAPAPFELPGNPQPSPSYTISGGLNLVWIVMAVVAVVVLFVLLRFVPR